MPVLTNTQVDNYQRDGFVLVPQLLDTEETDLLGRAAREDRELDRRSQGRADGEGGSVRMSLWNHPGNGIYGMVARSARIVDSMEAILDGEVYHYHTKLTAKEPKEGGSWEWHQDYGYWYHNGILQPLMANVIVPLDDTTKDNGCLEVLRGSHHMGRIDHDMTKGDQAWADQERMTWAEEEFESYFCEMGPGDGLFFHCNLLHRSAANLSPNRRWTLIFCYNAARNNPRVEHNHPFYTLLDKVEDSAIKEIGVRLSEGTVEDFKTKRVNPPGLKPGLEKAS